MSTHQPTFVFESVEHRLLLAGARAFDFDGEAREVAVQPDGKAVVAGTSGDGFRLARFNTDASLDQSFGNEGTLDLAFLPRGIDVQPDGKILLVGGDGSVLVERRNPNGQLDKTFSGDGRASLVRIAGTRGNALAIQTDGKILLGGTAQKNFVLVRVNPNGSLDKSFGGGDAVVLTDFDNRDDSILGLGLLPDGRILAGGGSLDGNEDGERYAVARYRPDGSLDNAFSSDGRNTGKLHTSFDGDLVFAPADFAVFPDGTSYFIGTTGCEGAPVYLKTDGTLDPKRGNAYYSRACPTDDALTEGYDLFQNKTEHDESVEVPGDGSGDDHNFLSFGKVDFGGDEYNGREWHEFEYGTAGRDGFGAAVGVTGNSPSRWGIHMGSYKPTQGPFRGTPFGINKKIQAEDFDHGGRGVAYSEKGARNNGGAYRTSQVDVGPGGSKYVVGFTAAGEWLEYTVDVPTGGIYRIDVAAANKDPGGVIHFEFEGEKRGGTIAIPDNNSFSRMQVVSKSNVQLDAGRYVVRLAFDKVSKNGAAGNIDWFRLVRTSLPDSQAPSAPPRTRVSRRTLDEVTFAWNAASDNVGVTRYKVYRDGQLVARLPASQRTYTIKGTSKDDLFTRYNISVVAFDAVGNRSPASSTHAVRLSPPQGEQDGYFWGDFFGRVDAEFYDRGGEGVAYHDNDGVYRGGGNIRDEEAVDLGPTTEPRPGNDTNHVVAFTQPGEWLEYTLDITEAGTYRLDVRASNGAAGAAIHFDIDGDPLTGSIAIPNTGGFNNYVTVAGGNVQLTEGRHVIRLSFDKAASNGSVGNYDYFALVKQD